jgi:hypothetical protein
MIALKKNVSVEVDAATAKKLGRASKALSELASAFIQGSDKHVGSHGTRRSVAR